MLEENYLHELTIEEFNANMTQTVKNDMEVEAFHQAYAKKRAEEDGKIPDEDWMKML